MGWFQIWNHSHDWLLRFLVHKFYMPKKTKLFQHTRWWSTNTKNLHILQTIKMNMHTELQIFQMKLLKHMGKTLKCNKLFQQTKRRCATKSKSYTCYNSSWWNCIPSFKSFKWSCGDQTLNKEQIVPDDWQKVAKDESLNTQQFIKWSCTQNFKSLLYCVILKQKHPEKTDLL